MNLSTNNITELKDQLLLAIEAGDLPIVKRLLELFPCLKEEKVNGMSLLQFAARHGHSHIIKHLGVKQDIGFIKELIKEASVDGHKETISLLVNSVSDLFPYNDFNCEFYRELREIIPESCKSSIYFPYVWNKVKGMLFLYKIGKLPRLPAKKLAKFLY